MAGAAAVALDGFLACIGRPEEFFSLLKRDINGVYHHVGRGHSIWRHA